MFLQRFFAAFLSGPRFGANIRYELGMWSSLKIEGNDRKIMVFEVIIIRFLNVSIAKCQKYIVMYVLSW